MIFSVQIFITMKKDLSAFIDIMRFGTYFITALILFIVAVGVYSLTNTDFQFVKSDE
jgi:hypothetical protein